jgi:hypothetical protein
MNNYILILEAIRIFKLISFENEPTNASWGERYFHIREPDGYQIAFAKPIADK